MTQRLPPDLEPSLLTRYPVLRTLPAEDWAALCNTAGWLKLPAGAQVFNEQQNCMGFPLILAGTIKVVKSSTGGREMLLYRVAEGDSCIITASCLLAHSPYSARGIAETPVALLLLPIPFFEKLISEQRAFREFVFHLLAERIASLMQLVEEVAFQRLDQRLARLLLARGQTVHCTHQQLADELGSVREIVSRLLKGFAADGLVALGRQRIRLIDRAALQQLAGSGR